MNFITCIAYSTLGDHETSCFVNLTIDNFDGKRRNITCSVVIGWYMLRTGRAADVMVPCGPINKRPIST